MSALGESARDPVHPESRKRKGSLCDTSGLSAEKRRRELEGRYITELAELLSAHMGDIASLNVKPDKSHILRNAIDQIQQIKLREQGELLNMADLQSASNRSPPHARVAMHKNYFAAGVVNSQVTALNILGSWLKGRRRLWNAEE